MMYTLMYSLVHSLFQTYSLVEEAMLELDTSEAIEEVIEETYHDPMQLTRELAEGCACHHQRGLALPKAAPPVVALDENRHRTALAPRMILPARKLFLTYHPQFGPATGCSLSQSFGDSSFGIGSRLQVTRYGTPSSDDV